MTREQIDLDGGAMTLLISLSEGNPGAITVLSQMIKNNDNLIHLFSLDDMNMRGSQIWVGYKDYCGENIDAFIDCIRERDPEMVKVVNEECYRPEYGDGYQEKAVARGASWVK